ncbi:hypothetical protein P43SY_002207 [Pythium insidiosum]|uniref:Cyclic nucleotide-binding domain-containing protein n=1 Tax=Pythium insidiosum TaxID=114742 RepID=A0AAD5M937_PYTIN|nr:hypothetical protein P43SY_002207 [Pythium insidiosum]
MATSLGDGALAPTNVSPVPPFLQRKPTLASRGGSMSISTRRKTFLMELEDQMQLHRLQDLEQEKQKEVLALHRILQKPPETRDTSDIDTLYDWVLRNGSTNKIFQGAQEIICKTICREMTLLELPAGGVVCYQGDYGDVFFIIIAGSVSLFVDPKRNLRVNQQDDGPNGGGHNNASVGGITPSMSSARSSMRRTRTRRRHHLLDDDDDDDDDETTIRGPGGVKIESFGNFIKQIGAGGTFGELAVMDPTARRSATIICDVATSFICLKRGAYQRLIRMTHSTQLDFTQVEFLETLYFFAKWPHTELVRVSNRLRPMTFAADSFLTRIGSEANLVFFIYSGVVQETVPLVHHLNSNGNVSRCTTLESDAATRSLQDSKALSAKRGHAAVGSVSGASAASTSTPSVHRKLQILRRRVALELTLYQDHDICGEFPIICNKPVSNTDLLAVTDVKVLIMDRETWKDVFFMHGLEHIREAHRRFRQLAKAREAWRQTRIKLALANPGLHITISTKAMMQDGKCMCGWCGSAEHITGARECHALVASKKLQADKQRKSAAASQLAGRVSPPKTPKRLGQEIISTKAVAVKNTLQFVNQLTATVQSGNRKASAIAMGVSFADLETTPPSATHQQHSRGGRRISLKVAATRIISEGQSLTPAAAGLSPTESRATTADSLQLLPSRPSSTRSMAMTPPDLESAPVPRSPSSREIMTPQALSRSPSRAGSMSLTSAGLALSLAASVGRKHSSNGGVSGDSGSLRRDALPNQTHGDGPEEEPVPARSKTEDELRKATFPEAIQSSYREQLVRKVRRCATLEDYYGARASTLEQLKSCDAELAPPRKPRIPKPLRRLAMCSKNREPRPDRFNRRINRMLKRMWIKDHPLPVVEESLRDT